MACKNCEHISVSGNYCPYAESVYAKKCRIENPKKTPKWCPLKSNKKK